MIAYLPDEQPVGLNVTLPLPLAVACQNMGLILFFELLAVEQFTYNSPLFVHRQTTSLSHNIISYYFFSVAKIQNIS